MPAATFSYAQAAKGQMASGSTSPSAESTPVIGDQDQQVNDLPNGVTEPAAPATEARKNDLEAMRNSKAEEIPAASVSDASCTTNNDTSGSSGTSSNDSRRDDDTNSEVSARRSVNDNKSQGAPSSRASQSRPASTSTDSKRSRRERKPKGAKTADKEADAAENAKNAPPKPELFDSPVPTVNPWQQRQLANPKQGVGESATPSAPSTTTPAQTNARKGAVSSSSSQVKPGSDTVFTNGLGIHKKGGDGDVPGKNGLHHKNGARRTAEQLPSSDSSHWPTPDTATKDQKQQRPTDKSVEHQESHSQDGQGLQKGKQPKSTWVKMDFVPTVSFKTQIPPKGGRPRGGARGGRDGTTRGGGHSANAAKDGEKATGPSSSTKVNGDAQENARDAPANARGSSVPPTSTKQRSADAPSFRDQRKHSVPAPARSKDAATNVSSQCHNKEHNHTPPSLPIPVPAPIPVSMRKDTCDILPPQHHPSFLACGLIFDHQDQPREKHESRGERPRGGAPRGRGGYHASTSQLNAQHAPFTGGYTSNVTSRQQNPYSPPIRQNNQFNPYNSGPSRGGSGRGGRGGSNAGRGSGSNGNGRHAPSGSMMPYDPSFTHPSIMGYPQTPSPAFFFDPFLIASLSAQLSWYFSIQNLCRDIYLRTNMDSQGFVPLSLIASFNRVGSLLQNTNNPVQYVRQACLTLTDVEFVVGDDNVERLRTSHNPRHWVLPMEDRSESAQNDGPTNCIPAGQQYSGHTGMVPGGFPASSPAMNSYPSVYPEGQANSFPSPVSAERGTELVNGHSAEQGAEGGQTTTLKPTVPEFSPRSGPGDNTSKVDGTNVSTPLESQSEVTSSVAEGSADNAASS